MSAEFGNGMNMIAEHDVTLMMAGNVETVRQRLIIALEQIGYRVVSENPLQARHGASGWASAYLSAIALEYPIELAVSFRSHGSGATQVTFDYCIEHSGIFTTGDCQTLTREAEAIVALASQHAQPFACAGCGTMVSGEARFCRKCGAPIKSHAPAELEVLRLTAGARAGYQWIVMSVLLFLAGAFFPGLALLLDFPLFKFLVISGLLNTIGLWALVAGLRRLHLTLNPKTETARLPPPPRPIAAPITNELPIRNSITEAATDLLPAPEELPRDTLHREKEKHLV
ncbi:MAG: zinc ribbon domain-containing protein [Blastocatellia bacterium]